jgi:two-component system sensor histidine kinase ResE
LRRISATARAVASGEYRPIPLEGPSEVQELVRSFNEMSALVQVSQQSQRDFVANVSHDLKTPLTSIQGFAQAILDGTANNPEALNKATKVIHAEASRMNRLVTDLLELARLDSGIVELERAPLNLAELLKGVIEQFNPQVLKADIDLKVEIDPISDIIGDSDRLKQVFTNLIDNALKHTPISGSITLRARQVESHVEVLVSDTGPGIPPGELSRIFERFYQVDKSRRGGSERGMGLGLAIAHEIVTAHGGTISAHNNPKQGSSFVVKLPVAQSDDYPLVKRRT